MVLAVPRWQNWAGNQAAAPQRVITPRSAEEVAETIALATLDGLTVRMTGSGHSFTPVAVTSGVMLQPGGLRAIRAVDEDGRRGHGRGRLPAPGPQRVPVRPRAGPGEHG